MRGDVCLLGGTFDDVPTIFESRSLTQIGESSKVALDSPPATGTLVIVLRESSSEEPIEGVSIALSGPSSGQATTDANGEARFSGLPEGSYRARFEQAEFEMTPDEVGASVTGGEEERIEAAVARVIVTLTLKRIHIQGLLKALRGDKGELEYGHWWIEIDGAESYGWWPGSPVSIRGTLLGTPGRLNGGPRFGGTGTRDPHHGDSAEEMFNPRVLSGQPAEAIKSCVRGFAGGYSGKWSWPWGQNCHSFQEAMMSHCRLSKAGSKKVS